MYVRAESTYGSISIYRHIYVGFRQAAYLREPVLLEDIEDLGDGLRRVETRAVRAFVPEGHGTLWRTHKLADTLYR